MNIRSWFDMARRVVNLTVQLDAKKQELHDAHRALAKAQESTKFYIAQCDRKEVERRALVDAHNDQLRRLADANDRALVPMVPAALADVGSRERANARRLEDANEQLRHENEELVRENVRLAGLVDECTTKHGDDVRAERDSLRQRFDEARRTIAALRSDLYDRRFEGGEHG